MAESVDFVAFVDKLIAEASGSVEGVAGDSETRRRRPATVRRHHGRGHPPGPDRQLVQLLHDDGEPLHPSGDGEVPGTAEHAVGGTGPTDANGTPATPKLAQQHFINVSEGK